MVLVRDKKQTARRLIRLRLTELLDFEAQRIRYLSELLNGSLLAPEWQGKEVILIIKNSSHLNHSHPLGQKCDESCSFIGLFEIVPLEFNDAIKLMCEK